jgi:GNAT superfamily N-acetyltransferase
VATVGADVSSTPSAPSLDRDEWRVREADGEADAFYLQRLWHHWFGAPYESQQKLQHDLFPIAGWSLPDDADTDAAPLDAFGVIAEHRRDDHAVRVGGAIVALFDHETAVEELPDGRFDPDALAGETNAWLLLSVVDQAWRGEGIGSELLARRLAWVRETDAEMAFACGWERDGSTSRPLLEAAGFVPVQRIEEMYAESARSACPDCGVWPSDDALCRCDATLWALDLTEVNDADD